MTATCTRPAVLLRGIDDRPAVPQIWRLRASSIAAAHDFRQPLRRCPGQTQILRHVAGVAPLSWAIARAEGAQTWHELCVYLGMLVQDLMTRHPKTLDVTGTVRDAVALLSELDVRHLPVMEGSDLIGIVSDRDLRELLGPESDDPDERARRLDARVTTAMSSNVISAEPEDELADVIDLMIENRLGAVPIVQQDPPALVGMVSYVDILREAKEAL